ncbi:MAG: phosphoadenosine phosphosulfate reductase family protein [Candidatus Njordarchaeia archaeon]
MGEWFPFIKSDQLGFVSSGGDITRIVLGGVEKSFLWVDQSEAYLINGLVEGENIIVDGEKLYIWRLIDLPPMLYARSFSNVYSYVSWLAKQVAGDLSGRRVLLSFSGGKDSLASLIVSLLLLEYVSFDLRIVYVHVPYLDSLDKLKFVDEVSKRLNVEIEVVEADRYIFRKKLERYGMPYRGFRWCTYQKVRPIREIKRKYGIDFEIVGERVWESYKRLLSLREFAKQGKFLIGGKFRPTYFFTLLDVVDICKKFGLVNPEYLKGMTRVSCELCPYKNLFEFKGTFEKLEDAGFIERIIDKTWKEHYSWIDKNVFHRKYLWRFSDKIVGKILKLHREVERLGKSMEKLDESSLSEIYRNVWVKNFNTDFLNIDEVRRRILDNGEN